MSGELILALVGIGIAGVTAVLACLMPIVLSHKKILLTRKIDAYTDFLSRAAILGNIIDMQIQSFEDFQAFRASSYTAMLYMPDGQRVTVLKLIDAIQDNMFKTGIEEITKEPSKDFMVSMAQNCKNIYLCLEDIIACLKEDLLKEGLSAKRNPYNKSNKTKKHP